MGIEMGTCSHCRGIVAAGCSACGESGSTVLAAAERRGYERGVREAVRAIDKSRPRRGGASYGFTVRANAWVDARETVRALLDSADGRGEEG